MCVSKIKYLFFTLIVFFNANVFIGCKNKILHHKPIVLVTAPAIYNTRLCKLINDTSLTAISFPVIKTSLIEDNPGIDSLLYNVEKYDWIALPSRNAVKALFTRAQELKMEGKLKDLQYCAIGKDQEYLKSFGVTTTVLKNTEPSPQGIVDALKQQKLISSGKIAVLAPRVIGMPEPDVVPNFIDSLQANNWEVTKINAYTTKVCHPQNAESIIAEIKKGDIDLIAFTSTAEIEALLQLIGGKENLSEVPIACFGPYTLGNAKKLGLNPVFMAKDYSSFQGYVDAICRFMSKSQ